MGVGAILEDYCGWLTFSECFVTESSLVLETLKGLVGVG